MKNKNLNRSFEHAVDMIRAATYFYVGEYKKAHPNMVFITKPKTTNSWNKFRKEIKNNQFITSTEGCEYTIYDSVEDNVNARIHHDICHLQLDMGFSYEEEEEVCEEQIQQIRKYGEENLWSEDIINLATQIIFIDIVGQAAYYKDNGKFVNHQKSFVQHMLYN